MLKHLSQIPGWMAYDGNDQLMVQSEIEDAFATHFMSNFVSSGGPPTYDEEVYISRWADYLMDETTVLKHFKKMKDKLISGIDLIP